MKRILITLISFYQILLSPLFKHVLGVRFQCRYSPTCSTYAKQSLEQHGVLKGTRMAVQRLLSCQPFTKSSYGNI